MHGHVRRTHTCDDGILCAPHQYVGVVIKSTIGYNLWVKPQSLPVKLRHGWRLTKRQAINAARRRAHDAEVDERKAIHGPLVVGKN